LFPAKQGDSDAHDHHSGEGAEVFVLKITKVASSGVQGSAEFSNDETNTKTHGSLQFRMTEHNGCKDVSVVDPFDGQNPSGYQTLVELIKFELIGHGLI